ncbi:lycopene cyclase [Sphingorhabdus lutea]|uniref:Lycopene cyclase n=1 Tax=Sphingorhabdus lutea TaxID=1913578 RepID=A0A1L3J916_9SPHN|nr:lycopene beta-cyclase CrtY [Sphingorhabdus lutea]APG61629.1 lycopene cyclase [Sphingorhabdus lutea]
MSQAPSPEKNISTPPANLKCDVAIVGGGLAGGLAAIALAKMRPELKVMLIEQNDHFGGNHLWSFFSSDIDPQHSWLIAPLITYGWAGYNVDFPKFNRHLDNKYYSITSDRLDEYLREILPADNMILSANVKALSPRLVVLKGGQRINASCVIDARGGADTRFFDCGWQKFCGQMLQLSDPHGLKHPIIMDASVDQSDGYRFVYVLPFGMDKLFIEDTYYHDEPEMQVERWRGNIARYAAQKGWNIDAIIREEAGVLPVIMGGDLEKYWNSGGSRIAKIGARGAFFHAVTSYSLPDAVRIAAFIAQQDDLDGDKLHMQLYHRAQSHWSGQKYYHMLNKMLFRAAEPAERYRVLERFYTLSPQLIGRFYNGTSSIKDKIRLLSGRPPVPITKAVKALGAAKYR